MNTFTIVHSFSLTIGIICLIIIITWFAKMAWEVYPKSHKEKINDWPPQKNQVNRNRIQIRCNWNKSIFIPIQEPEYKKSSVSSSFQCDTDGCLYP